MFVEHLLAAESARPVAEVHVTQAVTHRESEVERIPTRERGVGKVERHRIAVHLRRVPARRIGGEAAPADFHIEHVLDGHLDPPTYRGHANRRQKEGGEGGLPAERRMHHHGRCSYGTRQLGGTLEFHKWIAAPHEVGRQQHRRVDGQNRQSVLAGKREEDVG